MTALYQKTSEVSSRCRIIVHKKRILSDKNCYPLWLLKILTGQVDSTKIIKADVEDRKNCVSKIKKAIITSLL